VPEGNGIPNQVYGYVKTVFKIKQCQSDKPKMSELFAPFPYKEVQQGHKSLSPHACCDIEVNGPQFSLGTEVD